MPGPKELAAPHFDGTPEDLKEFLEEIEVRGRDNNLGSRDHILHAIRYVSGSERALWRKHAAVIGSDWNRFKARMMSLYPGSDDSSANTVTELEVLVETQASILVTDIRQFGMYHRKYTVIADALLARGKISLRERSKLFLAGLHIDFRNQVRTQLHLLDPTHPIDEPYTITQMEEAAKFLLEGKGGQAPFALPSLTATQSSHPAVPAASAPRETFDMTAMQQLMTSLTAANTKMMSEFMAEMRNQQNTVTSSFTQQSRPFNPQFSTQSGCRACSDPSHFIRYCPKVTEYIRQGRCIRDQTNRICLPNGVLVTPRVASGKDILERVDNWHSANPTTANNTSASIVQTNTFEAVPSSSPSPSASATATSQFHATTSPDNELQVLDAVTVAALRRQDEIRAHSKTSGKSKVNPTSPKNSSTTPPTTVQPSQSTNSQSASSSQPQYRYSTPIEDPAITQNVIQRSLDTPFPITLRELYSTSPDVRKLIKDQITTRRIPVGQTATVTVEDVPEENDPAISSFIHQHSHRLNSIIVANQTEDLRTITLELDGKVSVNAILDEGSQITAIRRDIWEKLGLPLLSNEKMIMESANSSREATMGLLRDLPARIGRSTFYLQVQVVENTSYEMLLGRPFVTTLERILRLQRRQRLEGE
ncbi:hypothetical protein Agabi119p4_8430 [Agaricus bisporus var. burnettii]|uniref:Peptidase A2 domain-containing protein n=1 Tax=Agaricus bisporus var. burnettii TaxID=192524 RepID=A0A8H7C5U0_AGABI|nr:hypothetical protein Agabi119p4_8430 [Agaricus bisporus var. burnettii]